MKRSNLRATPPNQRRSPNMHVKNSRQSSTKSMQKPYPHSSLSKSQTKNKNKPYPIHPADPPENNRHKYSQSATINHHQHHHHHIQSSVGQVPAISRYGSRSRNTISKRNSITSQYPKYPPQQQQLSNKYKYSEQYKQYNSNCKSSAQKYSYVTNNEGYFCQHCGHHCKYQQQQQRQYANIYGDRSQVEADKNIYVCDDPEESQIKQYRSVNSNIKDNSRNNYNNTHIVNNANNHPTNNYSNNPIRQLTTVNQNSRSKGKKQKNNTNTNKNMKRSSLSQVQQQQLNIFLDNYQNILNQRLGNLRIKWNQLQVLEKSINNIGHTSSSNNNNNNNNHPHQTDTYPHNEHTLQIQNQFYVTKITELQNQMKNKQNIIKELNSKIVQQQNGYDRKTIVSGQDRKEIQWENRRYKEENALLQRENRVLKEKLKECGVL